MQDAISSGTRRVGASDHALAQARVKRAALTDLIGSILSSLLLILAFPDFDFWPLAWLGLVPLLVVIARRPASRPAFLMGWLTGTVFFYGSCHWLTFSMIHYGGIPRWLAYILLLPAPLIAGLFVGAFAFLMARSVAKWGPQALLAAPLLWPTFEWIRLLVIGQLWNAIGYSQSYQPELIQTARWGGVYMVGFLVVCVNAAIAFLLVRRTLRAALTSGLVILGVAILMFAANANSGSQLAADRKPELIVVALQPNVPMSVVKSSDEVQSLIERHISMSQTALSQLPDEGVPRLVIWPESPMNFAYGNDPKLRDLLLNFATRNRTAVLFNSQEAAPNDGIYNSAVLINEQGSLIAQYDKIRLMPFGEYVPLPRWVPGTSLIGAIVGDFTPGTKYTVMELGAVRAGVFICIESAYPSIAGNFTRAGAEVMINISNDGYLGPTAVMRQHLANVVFRAVENGRPILRVTNTGISVYITSTGQITDATGGFQTAVRTWTVRRGENENTFYSKRGDLFVGLTAALSLLLSAGTFVSAARREAKEK